MSRQWICPRCQGEFHAAEDHYCQAGGMVRGPDLEGGPCILPEKNAANPRRDQEDDEASRRT
jgi:hypothetical protein